MRAAIDQGRSEAIEQAGRVEEALVRSLQETANALYAHLGEIDDKLDGLIRSTAHTRET